MELTGVNSGQAQNYVDQAAKAEQTEMLYQVKLLKMQQQSDEVVGTLLEDTAEISQEAMQRYLSEIKG